MSDQAEKSVKRIDAIQQICDDKGVDINDAFREAKVPRDTIFNWRKKNPKQFEAEDKVMAAIEKLAQDKNEAVTT